MRQLHRTLKLTSDGQLSSGIILLYMKASIFYIATLLLSQSIFAQGRPATASDLEDLRKLCEQVLCRPANTVRVNLKDGTTKETKMSQAFPIVNPGGLITVMPGETIYVAFEVDGGLLKNPRAVQGPVDHANLVSFRFFQKEGESDSYLVVSSNVSFPVKYDLGMMLPEGERILGTSSCTLLPGKPVYEMWPQPVFQFVATHFRQSEGVLCN